MMIKQRLNGNYIVCDDEGVAIRVVAPHDAEYAEIAAVAAKSPSIVQKYVDKYDLIEVRKKLEEIDQKSQRAMRAIILGSGKNFDYEKLKELDNEAALLRARLGEVENLLNE